MKNIALVVYDDGRPLGGAARKAVCDGKIDDLLPLWLEGGVNCMFPIEIGTWGADPVKYRKQYGQDLLLMGGFDKHILAKGKREIETLGERCQSQAPEEAPRRC